MRVGEPRDPVRRMHLDILSICAFACGFGGPDGRPPPCSRCWQDFCAAWNAGAAGLMPEPGANEIPPPALGSGKFDTPCERMHSANASACESAVFSVAVGLPEDSARGDQQRTAENDCDSFRHTATCTARRVTTG